MLRAQRGQNKVSLDILPASGVLVSSKPAPVTPGVVFYWVGLAVLLIVMATVVWNLFVIPPSQLGI
jgi:hypothetical protein